MLNQAILVGRLVADPKINEEGEKKTTTLTLAIPRSFKNTDGEYDTDFITCSLWGGIAENATAYCKKGDIVGVKGRLQSNRYENEDGTINYKVELIAEKVTFLSSRSEKEKEESEIERCGD